MADESDLLQGNRALLDRFRAGDRDALEQVYRAYIPGILRYLRSRVRLADEVDCMAQDVFIKVFSEGARMSYDGLRPFSAYVTTVAKNLLIDRLRRVARAGGSHGITPQDLAPRAPTPEETAEAEQLRHRVEALLARLTAFERRVYALRFAAGEPILQVAQSLGVTEYRVKKAEQAIRRRFFRDLKTAGYFEGHRWAGGGVERALMIAIIGSWWLG